MQNLDEAGRWRRKRHTTDGWQKSAGIVACFFSQQPLGNVRGSAQCHSVEACPLQRATPKFTTAIKHVLSSPPFFWLRFSRPPLCLTFGCVWVPLVPAGSRALSLCWGPRCTQLESRAKDLPFVLCCWVRPVMKRLRAEKKQSHSGLFPSSEILMSSFRLCFWFIPLCSLGDIALKDFNDPLKSSQAWPRWSVNDISVLFPLQIKSYSLEFHLQLILKTVKSTRNRSERVVV